MKCHRCKKETKKVNRLRSASDDGKWIVRLDLCDECVESLTGWLEAGSPVAEVVERTMVVVPPSEVTP